MRRPPSNRRLFAYQVEGGGPRSAAPSHPHPLKIIKVPRTLPKNRLTGAPGSVRVLFDPSVTRYARERSGFNRRRVARGPAIIRRLAARGPAIIRRLAGQAAPRARGRG